MYNFFFSKKNKNIIIPESIILKNKDIIKNKNIIINSNENINITENKIITNTINNINKSSSDITNKLNKIIVIDKEYYDLQNNIRNFRQLTEKDFEYIQLNQHLMFEIICLYNLCYLTISEIIN